MAKTRSKWQRFPMLLLGLALFGCLRTVPSHRDPPSVSRPPEAIPLTVAVHMDDAFRQYTYRERNFDLPLGELLAQRAPLSLGTVFREVQVTSDPSGLGAATYQVLLHPRIRFATYHPFFRQRQTLLEPEGRVRIYSDWTLSDRSGREIWSQEIVGQAEGDPRSRSRLEAAVEAATADLLKKLQSALVRSSPIASYAKDARRIP